MTAKATEKADVKEAEIVEALPCNLCDGGTMHRAIIKPYNVNTGIILMVIAVLCMVTGFLAVVGTRSHELSATEARRTVVRTAVLITSRLRQASTDDRLRAVLTVHATPPESPTVVGRTNFQSATGTSSSHRPRRFSTV